MKTSTMPRDQFVGVYVAAKVKEALVKEAEANGVAVSVIVNNYLADGLGTERIPLDRATPTRGRKSAPRGRLQPGFRALLADRLRTKSPAYLADRSGFLDPRIIGRLARGTGIALTEKTLTRLGRLAKLVQYKGGLTE